ncbi:D-alanine--D-alanine ligase, partial [Bacteroidia bacterium]|nr:D-alanine--D-alanine ligase [Bacteroidia bacterium]
DVAKRILTESGIANSKFLSFRKSERDQISYEKAQTILGLPLYIKPPNLGSSVGISKVTTKSEFSNAIELALSFDRKVLIEENIVGREIECAVIGNNDVHASPVGEVVTIGENHTFYSYEAKYTDANGSVTVIPAEMDSTTQDRIRDIAIKTYKALNCEGMARVDVFLKDNGDIIVNEVNSLPGFTDISMYPQLWEAGGVSYTELISKLLALAIERNIEDNKMLTSIE